MVLSEAFNFVFSSRKKRARGSPGARCTRGLMCDVHQKKMLHTSIQVQRKHSGLPCAMSLRLIRALPRDLAFLFPSPSGLTADLTPTLGRQDHTLPPYAGLHIVTRSRRPPRPAPTSVTTADVPSSRDRMAVLRR